MSKMVFRNVSFGANFFKFLNDPSFFMTRIPDYDSTKKQVLIITKEIIDEFDHVPDKFDIPVSRLVDLFLETVIPDYKKPTVKEKVDRNIFAAIYQDDKLVMFGRPLICQHEREIALIFGTATSDNDYNKVPLKWDKKGHYINGKPVAMSFVEYPDMESADPNKNKIKVPLVEISATEGNTKYIFELSVRTDKGTSYHEVAEAWSCLGDEYDHEALLKTYIKPLYGEGTKLNIMFRDLFSNKVFPKDGILLKVVGARYVKDTEFPFVSLAVDLSDYPPVNVLIQDKDGERKIDRLVPLNEIQSILVSDKHLAGQKIVSDLLVNKSPTLEKPYWLHVKGSNKKNPSFIPDHILYDSGFISPQAKKLMEFISVPNYYLGGVADKDHVNLLDTIAENPL